MPPQLPKGKENKMKFKNVETFIEVVFNNDSASDYDEAMDKVEEYRKQSWTHNDKVYYWAIDTDDCEEGIRTIRLIKCDQPILTN